LQPIIVLAILVSLVSLTGIGFLAEPWNEFDVWVQKLGWGEENIVSPTVDSSLELRLHQIPGTATWFNNAWQFRKEITINSAQVAADLTNFPVLISITDAQLGASALPNGDDIVFTSSDGVTKLSHEIESWDETPDTLVAWVKGSVSSLANTKIYMYYGNSLATNQEDVTGTWNSNYKAVTHLHSDTADSTSNNNDGTNNGSTDGTGKIANGQTFDGINDDISFADNPSLDLGTAGTISIWVKSTDTKAANEFAVNWDQTLAGRWGVYAGTDDKVHAFFRNNAGGLIGGSSHGGTTNVDTNWRYVTLTYDGSASRVYVNGVQEKSNAAAGQTIASITNTGYLGKHPNNVASNRWEGGLDEFRVSNTARSAAWIQTEYNNQNNPGAFYTVGSEESSGGPINLITSCVFHSYEDIPTGSGLSQGSAICKLLNAPADEGGVAIAEGRVFFNSYTGSEDLEVLITQKIFPDSNNNELIKDVAFIIEAPI